MDSSDDDNDYEASVGGLDTSDESGSSSEIEYSSDSDSDDGLMDGRDWYRLDVYAENMNQLSFLHYIYFW